MAVVEILKRAAEAEPEQSRASEGDGIVLAHGPSSRVYCTRLWWAVKLELVVCDYGASAVVLIVQDAVLEGAIEDAVADLFRRCRQQAIIGLNARCRHTCAVSRFCASPIWTLPSVKTPSYVSSHPSGAASSGAMPSGTDWASAAETSREKTKGRNCMTMVVYQGAGKREYEWTLGNQSVLSSIAGYGRRSSPRTDNEQREEQKSERAWRGRR